MQHPIQIELPVVFDESTVNSWLFKGSTNTLVDCGMKTDASWDALVAGLDQQGLAISDIHRVIITHGHADHMGAAAKVAEEAGAEIWIPEFLEPWAIDLPRQIEKRSDLYKTAFYSHADDQLFKWIDWVDKLPLIWDPIAAAKVKVFANDAVLDIGEHQWQTIYTPGHCINQVVFYQKDHKCLLSADMILKMTPVPYFDLPIDRHIEGRTPVIEQLLESYQKIDDLDIEYIYPGHAGMMGDPTHLIAKQTSRIQDNIQRCTALIREGKDDLSAIMHVLYPKRINDSTFFMVVAILDYLVDHNLVDRALVEGKFKYFAKEHSPIPAKQATI